jgi:hypothetical protein
MKKSKEMIEAEEAEDRRRLIETAHTKNEIVKLKEIHEFFDKREKLYSFILKTTTSMTVENLYKVVKNEIISGWIFDSRVEAKRYFRISDALDSVAIDDKRSIIIGIDELSIYMVFNSTKSYLYLMGNLYDEILANKERINPVNISLTVRQILRENEERKPAFRIEGSENNIELVRKHCTVLFKNPTILMTNNNNKKQIMICITVENLTESNKKIDELKRYIVDHDMELFDNIVIYQIPESKHNNITYTISQVRDELANIKDIIDYLQRNPDENKSVIFNFGNISQTVINGNNNTSKTKNRIKTEKMTDEMRDAIKMDAEKWILELIKRDALNNKSTKETHDNYANHKENSLSIQEFGRLVSSHGYMNKKRGNEHTWVKK